MGTTWPVVSNYTSKRLTSGVVLDCRVLARIHELLAGLLADDLVLLAHDVENRRVDREVVAKVGRLRAGLEAADGDGDWGQQVHQ